MNDILFRKHFLITWGLSVEKEQGHHHHLEIEFDSIRSSKQGGFKSIIWLHICKHLAITIYTRQARKITQGNTLINHRIS